MKESRITRFRVKEEILKSAAVKKGQKSKLKVAAKKKESTTSGRRTRKQPGTYFRFLDLPPEIRNSIYELVLDENKTIFVQPSLKLPPLLASCSQICDEAASIWNRDNDFETLVQDCNATLLNKWTRHCCTVGQRDYFNVSIALRFTRGNFPWKNLIKWSEAIWKDDKDRRVLPHPRNDERERMVCRAHGISMYYQGKPWTACLHALQDLRAGVYESHASHGTDEFDDVEAEESDGE